MSFQHSVQWNSPVIDLVPRSHLLFIFEIDTFISSMWLIQNSQYHSLTSGNIMWTSDLEYVIKLSSFPILLLDPAVQFFLLCFGDVGLMQKRNQIYLFFSSKFACSQYRGHVRIKLLPSYKKEFQASFPSDFPDYKQSWWYYQPESLVRQRSG